MCMVDTLKAYREINLLMLLNAMSASKWEKNNIQKIIILNFKESEK